MSISVANKLAISSEDRQELLDAGNFQETYAVLTFGMFLADLTTFSFLSFINVLIAKEPLAIKKFFI